MTLTVPRRRGKLRREEMTSLPPNIQRAFIAKANGCNWIECAEVGKTSTANLRKWRQHPLADEYIQTAIDLNLEEAHDKFADNAEKLAQELVDIALSPKTRAYAKVTAIDTAFKILQQGITDKRNREEMKQIRETLERLEGGQAPDCIDVEST